MIVVLMDTRHHRTVDLPYAGPSVLHMVECEDGRLCEVLFHATGDRLCGDWIYLQFAGPEIPERWWHRA